MASTAERRRLRSIDPTNLRTTFARVGSQFLGCPGFADARIAGQHYYPTATVLCAIERGRKLVHLAITTNELIVWNRRRHVHHLSVKIE
jgi:hypothetical protein